MVVTTTLLNENSRESCNDGVYRGTYSLETECNVLSRKWREVV